MTIFDHQGPDVFDMDFHQIKISKIVASKIEMKMPITNLDFLLLYLATTSITL